MIEPIEMYQLRCDNCKEVIKPDGEHSAFAKEDLDEWISILLSDGDCLFKVGKQVVCDKCRYLGEDDELHIKFSRWQPSTIQEKTQFVKAYHKGAHCRSKKHNGVESWTVRHVENKKHIDISDTCDTEAEAWESAYSRIKNQTK